MDIIHQAKEIFGGKIEPLSLMEKRIEKRVGNNALVYVIDWKLRKVRILLIKKTTY